MCVLGGKKTRKYMCTDLDWWSSAEPFCLKKARGVGYLESWSTDLSTLMTMRSPGRSCVQQEARMTEGFIGNNMPNPRFQQSEIMIRLWVCHERFHAQNIQLTWKWKNLGNSVWTSVSLTAVSQVINRPTSLRHMDLAQKPRKLKWRHSMLKGFVSTHYRTDST